MTRNGDAASFGAVRVGIYCRYSSDMQNPRSIADQVMLCQRYAERQGWHPVPSERIFCDEAASGGSVQRTNNQRLLGKIAASNGRPVFDVILTEDLSRLTRDMAEATRLIRMAPIWGLRIIGVSDGQDTSQPSGQYSAMYKGIGNQQFLDDLRARIRRGLVGRFEDGFHPGGTVFGYRSVPVPHPSGWLDRWERPLLLGRKLEIDPEQAAVVRRIYTKAAAGQSPRDIAAGLDRDHIPNPCQEYTMTKGASRTTTPWNHGTVMQILRNERYRGQWRWQKTVCVGRHPDTGKKDMRPAPDRETLEQHREALRLIADRLWVKVQQVLDTRAEGVKRDPTTGRLAGREKGQVPGQVFGHRTNALNGLLSCGVCGGPMNVIMTKAAKDGSLVRYLGCLNHHRFKQHCTNAGVCRLTDLEAALGEALRGHFSDTKLMQEHFRRFLRALDAHRRAQTAEEQQAKADQAAAEAEIGKVKAAILAGVVGETTKTMLRDAEAKQAQATQKLAAAEEARLAEPRLVPPRETLAGLNARHLQERREAYRRLLSEIRLRSERKPRRRNVTGWMAEIVPRPEAGITGLPKSVAFGKGFIAVGRSASGRDGRRAYAAD